MPKLEEQILKMVIRAYRALNSTNLIEQSWEEDQITQELLYEMQNAWSQRPFGDNSGYVLQHQFFLYPKLKKMGKPPTIDFVFRRGYGDQSYIGFECKKVASANSTSIREYIKEGMKRYIDGIYSKESKTGTMVAYVFESGIDSIVLMINEKIKGIDGLSASDSLEPSGISLDGFNSLYCSVHTRNLLGPINLRHLFLAFGC